MFQKLTGIKCPPLDYYISSAILIHIIILIVWYSSSGTEHFEPGDSMEDYCYEYPDDPECYEDISSGMDPNMITPIGGMFSVLLFVFIYMFTQGIYLKLLCKNNMNNSAWFIVLAPLISFVVICLISLFRVSVMVDDMK